jgi:hypothetical protein
VDATVIPAAYTDPAFARCPSLRKTSYKGGGGQDREKRNFDSAGHCSVPQNSVWSNGHKPISHQSGTADVRFITNAG